ncbi:unnamed protein product [Rhodiola kirilowii]
MGGDGAVSNVSYSSGEEDGNDEWRAAISSVSNTLVSSSNVNLSSSPATQTSSNFEDGEERRQEPQKIKHYQIKAQKLLEGILEKTLDIVENSVEKVDERIDDGEEVTANGGGIRLFKHAPPGVVFDHIDELRGPTKRPNLKPGQEIDEKSKKFKRKLQSVAVDGSEIKAAANKASQKSLGWLEAKEAKAKEVAKKEEQRVSELKKIRGERWLPSIARDMQIAKPTIRRA